MKLALFPLLLLTTAALGQSGGSLSGTSALPGAADFPGEMVAGIARWLEQETARVAAERDARWRERSASPEWPALAETQRQRLRAALGAIDPVTPGALEELRDITPAEAPTPDAARTVRQVRWPVFARVHGEGVLLLPAERPRACVIVLPDADELPEDCHLAQRLAAQGCVVLVPALVDRRDTWSGSATLGRWTNQPHREWIQRQAYEVGRTIVGYEVQKVSAAADALLALSAKLKIDRPIAIAGASEGGLVALCTAAVDTRLEPVLVCGSFGPREQLAAEPIYRNAHGLLRDFGDAGISRLVAPRPLLVAHTRIREIAGPPEPRAGRAGAAPGRIAQPALRATVEEIRRANDARPGPAVRLIRGAGDEPLEPAADRVVQAFAGLLKLGPARAEAPEPATVIFNLQRRQAREQRAVRELEEFTQGLASAAERAREKAVWSQTKPGPAWDAVQAKLRGELSENVIGRISAPKLPPNPRSRVVRESERWIAHEVVLDVLPEVFAWGWLLVPRDLTPGERRPVVVCQHGLEGLPEDVLNADEKSRPFAAYQAYAARLADEGFIVFAPHNPYRGGDAFRLLQRRANPLGLSLFSFIVAQHEAATDWLASLPFVDPERIAFYGLSYGGKSAMRLPALIPRYCLSICSADFNEWVRKVISPEMRMSYMFTPEWEIAEWNLAWVANYAEMAMLIAPRPFMVERGHNDGVALDEWVGYEFAKVQRGYDQLGIGDRVEIEWFEGPHTIHGVKTFDFLRRHLRWPTRSAR